MSEELFKDHPQMLEAIEDYKDSYDDAYQNFEPDEMGCGWHILDFIQDELRFKLMEKFYKFGFIRVGTFNNVVHFEGTSSQLSKMKKTCIDLAVSHGMEYKFEVVNAN